MLEASIRHGARINTRDSRGRTLLHMAVETASTPDTYIHALLNSS
jgi:ankyrin repeat protein